MSQNLSPESSPKTIDELLQANAANLLERQHGRLLTFQTSDELSVDVYNITAPFEYDGGTLIAGRTEAREDEVHSMTRFFRHDSQHDVWTHDESLPSLALQDPFVKKIHGKWVVGGVKVFSEPEKPEEVTGWHTQIYAGRDLRTLKPLVVGPHMMKDIRLTELANGDVAIFTRPQGKKGGAGKIGFTTVQRLRDVTPQVIQEAPIIPEIIANNDDEWGGVNDTHVLENGQIGVAGHLARYVKDQGKDSRSRQYYPITFIFDPITRKVSNEQIIADRNCFPDTDAKKPDLKEVAYTGGISLLGGLATWWGGVSDTNGAELSKIPDPYLIG